MMGTGARKGRVSGAIYDEAYEAGWNAAFGAVIDLINVDAIGVAGGYGLQIVRVLEGLRDKGLERRKKQFAR